MVEHMADEIYDNVCRVYPEMQEYEKKHDMKPKYARARRFSYYGMQIRHRGIFRDLVAILLISELFRRRGF
jgi:hypothetical protein